MLYTYTLTNLLPVVAFVLAAAFHIMGMNYSALGCVLLACFGWTCYSIFFYDRASGSALMLEACDKAFWASPSTTRPFPSDVAEAMCEMDAAKLTAAYARLEAAYPSARPPPAARKGEGSLSQ